MLAGDKLRALLDLQASDLDELTVIATRRYGTLVTPGQAINRYLAEAERTLDALQAFLDEQPRPSQ